jgi:hypothetical protein
MTQAQFGGGGAILGSPISDREHWANVSDADRSSDALIRHVTRQFHRATVGPLASYSIVMAYGGRSRIRTYDFHRVKETCTRNLLISEASVAPKFI